MHIRGVLFVVVVAVAGCSKDKAAPAPKPDPGSGSAKPAPAVVKLVPAPEAVAQPMSATTIVVIAKDGSLSVAAVEGWITGLGVGSVKGEPVAQVTDLTARLAALHPPPEEPPPEEEEEGGSGEAMALDEGKMGKKDSDRAEGQYKMKNNNKDPELAREEAIRAAKEAGILGVLASDPCAGAFASLTGTGDFSSGFDDADISGGRVRTGEGYGTGLRGSSGAGNGGGSLMVPAGLRARSTKDAPICGTNVPLVLADAGAPAARVIEVLSALPNSQLAITTDGGDHAKTLAALFSFSGGSGGNHTPTDTVEVGFTVGPDGTRGSAYRGASADATVWTWDGKGGLADAFVAASGIETLRGTTVRLRVDGDLTAGPLIEALGTLLAGDAKELALGEPIERKITPRTKIGQPTMTGDYEKAVVRRYLKRNIQKFWYCYEKELLANPRLEGKVDASWTIKPNGSVADATASGISKDVSSCVAAVIGAIEFPRPKRGSVNVTSYPFEFSPDGG